MTAVGPSHPFFGATRGARPPVPPFPVSVADAFGLAAWYVDYALDRLDATHHAAVRSHGKGAQAQLAGVNAALGLEP